MKCVRSARKLTLFTSRSNGQNDLSFKETKSRKKQKALLSDAAKASPCVFPYLQKQSAAPDFEVP
jgi:hypothetical protein